MAVAFNSQIHGVIPLFFLKNHLNVYHFFLLIYLTNNQFVNTRRTWFEYFKVVSISFFITKGKITER